ncbi:MAG: glycoside hydrolase family 9 protein [Melioribacteraceae bacterium]|jgi:endoglucanase|nr:glycoside hydrolase family 9 protein [Melioribacteraceae bacterium]
MKKAMKRYIVLLLLITSLSCAKSELFIRASQVGFAPNDIKTAIVLSAVSLEDETFFVLDSKSKRIDFQSKVGKSKGEFGSFPFSYEIDFTKFSQNGSYLIAIKKYASTKFKIDKNLFAPVVKELMRFFPVQRCGYTNPSEHEVCHIADGTSIIDGEKTINKTIDVTGGWHDAGDYVKFLNTTALSTYTLLFAYDFSNKKFGFDYNDNNAPDILEEAKVGLDWMLRAQTDDSRFITQVQNLQDHDVGWRLPENDTLVFNRPAYVGIGKNLIGIYSATMALASRIWEEKFQDSLFAKKCLESAEKYYKIKDEVVDVDSSGTGQYLDKLFEGKLALAAIELYETTQNKKYLNDAKIYGIESGGEYWWSYGNISTFAHYRLARYDKYFVSLIKPSLTQFNANRREKLFGEPVILGWGSNVTQIGTAIQAILYQEIAKNNDFDSLKISVRDYLLGKNQWGISFVSNIGSNYTKHLHHQISHIKKYTLPGGLAAGPIEKGIIKNYNLPFEKRDRYARFQTESAYYRDDRMDYVTNEPTIIGNAMAIFLFGYFVD